RDGKLIASFLCNFALIQVEGQTMPYRISVDIGGTFTDLVMANTDTKTTTTGKVLTTPSNSAIGVMTGLRQIVDDPAAIEFFVHGTTVGLNAFLERKGARVLLLM